MNMDYSEAFELLNQDAENERNKKAEKAVHDNLYNKGFCDGLAILDKIRAEIENTEIVGHIRDVECFNAGINVALNVIYKYMAESEDIAT